MAVSDAQMDDRGYEHESTPFLVVASEHEETQGRVSSVERRYGRWVGVGSVAALTLCSYALVSFSHRGRTANTNLDDMHLQLKQEDIYVDYRADAYPQDGAGMTGFDNVEYPTSEYEAPAGQQTPQDFGAASYSDTEAYPRIDAASQWPFASAYPSGEEFSMPQPAAGEYAPPEADAPAASAGDSSWDWQVQAQADAFAEATTPLPCDVSADTPPGSAGAHADKPCAYNLRGGAAKAFSSTPRPVASLKQPAAPQNQKNGKAASPTSNRTPIATTKPGTTTSLATTTTPTSTVTINTIPPKKLFCFAVMQPSGGEKELIVAQLGGGQSIFDCEYQAVYSNGNIELKNNGHSIRTKDIGDMHCEYGGPYHLALNSEIFVRAWKRVFNDAEYLKGDLTVKVDPDAVFFPSRLRKLMIKADCDANVYFNNCDQGLHGPIEVVARGGMKTFAKGIADCEKKLKDEYSWAGEDVFVRHCLGLLKVNRVDEYQLMSEDHCFHEDPARDGCHSGKASFHPFKTIDGWYKCYDQANRDK